MLDDKALRIIANTLRIIRYVLFGFIFIGTSDYFSYLFAPIDIVLQQWCNRLHHKADNLSCPRYVTQVLRCYLTAFFQRLLKIALNIADAGGACHICRALKMVIQAAVVKVYGADYCGVVVADKNLCVYKSRGVFIDAHTRSQQ